MSKSRFFNVWSAGIIVGVTFVFTAPSFVRAGSLDLLQAASFNSTKQSQFGWCTSITVGGTALSADFQSTDPTTSSKVSVAGFLADAGSPKIVHISVGNQQKAFQELAAANNNNLPKMPAAISGSLNCSVFTYDTRLKKYTRKDVSSSMSAMSVSAERNSLVQSPNNYQMMCY